MMGKWTSLGVVWLIVIGGALLYRVAAQPANVGAGYVAREVCGCVFVSERAFESCRADMPDFMAQVRAEPDSNAKAIRAWVPLLAERVATFRHDGGGCLLQ